MRTGVKTKLMRVGGMGPENADDIDRLVTASGILDFRIAAQPGDETRELIERAYQSLRERGPGEPIEERLRWFAVDESGRDNFNSSGFITGAWAGQPYVLLHDDPLRRLTHAAGRPWTITDARPTSDPHSGVPALCFELDPVGTALFAELTTNNVKRPLAILMDDRAISAPSIQTPITLGSCQITFGQVTTTHTAAMIRKEAQNLRNILDAGSLPSVRLKRIP